MGKESQLEKNIDKKEAEYASKVEEAEKGNIEDATKMASGEVYKKSAELGRQEANKIAGSRAAAAQAKATGAAKAAGLDPLRAAAMAQNATAQNFMDASADAQQGQQAAAMGSMAGGLQARMTARDNAAAGKQNQFQNSMAHKEQYHNQVKDWINTGSQMAGGFFGAAAPFFSDERTKNIKLEYKPKTGSKKEGR